MAINEPQLLRDTLPKAPVTQFFYVSDSKVHGANMGPTWFLSSPGGPHVGPLTLLSGVFFAVTWEMLMQQLMYKNVSLFFEKSRYHPLTKRVYNIKIMYFTNKSLNWFPNAALKFAKWWYRLSVHELFEWHCLSAGNHRVLHRIFWHHKQSHWSCLMTNFPCCGDLNIPHRKCKYLNIFLKLMHKGLQKRSPFCRPHFKGIFVKEIC